MLEGLKVRPTGELCAEHEISQAQYYQWRDLFLANAANAAGLVELRLVQEPDLEPLRLGMVAGDVGDQAGNLRIYSFWLNTAHGK